MPVQLEILTGPDQGKTYPLESELLHLGRGSDNSIVLADPEIGDFHVSFSVQQGQLSLYANQPQQIRVGENFLPDHEWVSVPEGSRIHLTGLTEVRVTTVPAGRTLSNGPAANIATGGEQPRPHRKESKRQVARPVTSRVGLAPVQLGADGRYPELALAVGTRTAHLSGKPKETNPVLLFTILAASGLSSAALLLIDLEPTSVVTRQDQSFARSQLAAYYGTDSALLEPYQKLLRQAAVEFSKGNRVEERRLLKQVLALLNSVDAAAPENLNGLTGRQTGRGKASDKDLRDLLQQVLN